MKQVLFMAMLVAGMLMTGCSKDSESMEDKQVTDIKQHIVGSWEHDGDFFCNDISELSGSINGNIISGCTSEFIDRNPATLVFGSDGRFELRREGDEKEYKGTYTVRQNETTGKALVWLKDNDGSHTTIRELPDFFYHEILFEADYNTAYFIAYSIGTVVARYKRR